MKLSNFWTQFGVILEWSSVNDEAFNVNLLDALTVNPALTGEQSFNDLLQLVLNKFTNDENFRSLFTGYTNEELITISSALKKLYVGNNDDYKMLKASLYSQLTITQYGGKPWGTIGFVADADSHVTNNDFTNRTFISGEIVRLKDEWKDDKSVDLEYVIVEDRGERVLVKPNWDTGMSIIPTESWFKKYIRTVSQPVDDIVQQIIDGTYQQDNDEYADAVQQLTNHFGEPIFGSNADWSGSRFWPIKSSDNLSGYFILDNADDNNFEIVQRNWNDENEEYDMIENTPFAYEDVQSLIETVNNWVLANDDSDYDAGFKDVEITSDTFGKLLTDKHDILIDQVQTEIIKSGNNKSFVINLDWLFNCMVVLEALDADEISDVDYFEDRLRTNLEAQDILDYNAGFIEVTPTHIWKTINGVEGSYELQTLWEDNIELWLEGDTYDKIFGSLITDGDEWEDLSDYAKELFYKYLMVNDVDAIADDYDPDFDASDYTPEFTIEKFESLLTPKHHAIIDSIQDDIIENGENKSFVITKEWLYNFLVGADVLDANEISDTGYFEDRVRTHLDDSILTYSVSDNSQDLSEINLNFVVDIEASKKKADGDIIINSTLPEGKILTFYVNQDIEYIEEDGKDACDKYRGVFDDQVMEFYATLDPEEILYVDESKIYSKDELLLVKLIDDYREQNEGEAPTIAELMELSNLERNPLRNALDKLWQRDIIVSESHDYAELENVIDFDFKSGKYLEALDDVPEETVIGEIDDKLLVVETETTEDLYEYMCNDCREDFESSYKQSSCASCGGWNIREVKYVPGTVVPIIAASKPVASEEIVYDFSNVVLTDMNKWSKSAIYNYGFIGEAINQIFGYDNNDTEKANELTKLLQEGLDLSKYPGLDQYGRSNSQDKVIPTALLRQIYNIAKFYDPKLEWVQKFEAAVVNTKNVVPKLKIKYVAIDKQTYDTDKSGLQFTVEINGMKATGFWKHKGGGYNPEGMDIDELRISEFGRISIFNGGGTHRSYEMAATPVLKEKQPANLRFTGKYYDTLPMGKTFIDKIHSALDGTNKVPLSDEFLNYFKISK